jgi:hypothetical protein
MLAILWKSVRLILPGQSITGGAFLSHQGWHRLVLTRFTLEQGIW